MTCKYIQVTLSCQHDLNKFTYSTNRPHPKFLFMKKLGLKEKIKKLRGNLTHKEFGSKIGVSGAAISYWEDGKYEPKFEYLKKIAAVCGVDIGYFYDLDEVRENRKNVISFPVVNYVPAHFGQIDDMAEPEWVHIDLEKEHLIPLRVTGDSMEPDFSANDVVLVREIKPDEIVNGEDYAVILDNETTVKKIIKQDDKYLLLPRNQVHSPKIVKKIKRVFQIEYQIKYRGKKKIKPAR